MEEYKQNFKALFIALKIKNELSLKTYVLLVGNVDSAIGSVEIYFLVCTG